MGDWVLVDRNTVVDLGDSSAVVQDTLLDLLINGKLSSPNAIVDVGSPNEASMAVGISAGRAYVEFGTKDGDPPFYRVVELSGSADSRPAVFVYKGERTPIPSRNCVSIDEMVRIVRHFVASESIPDWITTEEV